MFETTTPPRSLDDYLETARDATGGRIPWRFWVIFLSLGVANSSDATEILCLSYVLSEASFQDTILFHQAWRGSLLAAAVFFGMLVGGLVVGALGDQWGRRPTLLVGLAVNCICGFLSAGSWDVFSLSSLRLVAGLGIGASVPPLFTLCSELSPPADRGFWVTIAASFWMVGSIYVSVVGWFFLAYVPISWRVFVAACAVPSAAGFILVFNNVPESPRFLALQGHHEHTLAVAKGLADCLSYVGPPLTLDELLRVYPSRMDETAAQLSRENARRTLSLWKMVKLAFDGFLVSAGQLYTPSLTNTTWPLKIVWFSLSFGSYGLLTWINTLFFEVHLRNVYANAMLFALSNLPGNLLSAVLMDRTGRSSLLTGSVLAAAFSLLGFAYVAAVDDDQSGASSESNTSPSPVSKAWIVVAACAFQCFTIAAWNAIDVLTSELFPTTVRATGMGICAASGRIGAMFAQLINGFLVSRPVYLLVTAAVTLLLGAFTPMLLPNDITGQPVLDRVERSNIRTSAVDDDSHKDDSESRDINPATNQSSTYTYQEVSQGLPEGYQTIT